MVHRQNFPEGAVDIPREVDHSAFAQLAHVDLGSVRLENARVHLLHGQVRIRWNQREGRIRRSVVRPGVDSRNPVDDAVGVLQAGQNRMALSGRTVRFQKQVRVLHARIEAAVERRAEKVRQAEIRAARAPLVVERCFMRRDNAAAAADVFANLAALLGGERGDIGKDQNLELADVRRVQQPVVNHLERNARFDQRLVVAERVVFHLRARLRAAVIGCRLLRVNHRDARQGILVAEVPLVPVKPTVKILHHGEPAPVAQRAREFREPGTQSVGDPVQRP